MAYNENFLFFNDQTTAADASGEGALHKSSNFIGANVTGTKEVTLHFKSRNGAASDDTVAVTHGTGQNVKLLMQELTAVLSNPKGGIFYQSKFVGEAKNFLTGISNVVVVTAA